MDSAHSDNQNVLSDFISLFSSENRTEANFCVDSLHSVEDCLSIKWEQPIQIKKSVQKKKISVSKVDKKNLDSSSKKQPKIKKQISEVLSHSNDNSPLLPVNSQKSYSVYEDVLILNCRKSNKINPDREKFKNLSKLAVSLNRSGLGIQNRSRFLMRFNAEDKLKMMKFVEEYPAHAQKCSITWDILPGAKSKGNSKSACNLIGFVRFKPDQTKKRLYKERKRNSKHFLEGCSMDYIEESEMETTHFIDDLIMKEEPEQFNQLATSNSAEEQFENMSCLSLIFNRSDPELHRENMMLLHYIQEERQLAGSARRFSD